MTEYTNKKIGEVSIHQSVNVSFDWDTAPEFTTYGGAAAKATGARFDYAFDDGVWKVKGSQYWRARVKKDGTPFNENTPAWANPEWLKLLAVELTPTSTVTVTA